ncbi:MAG: molybdenum cofactor guanylyltransferase [Nitrososphaerota archaeon]|jgi:molybdopterin-guanine dinucleotide biosynthesis protein A|nr:molybdenum cofactor guanylyltransferase [Nitrososphaerota archaeon]
MASRAALVLAGGNATRFQMGQQGWQDKALILFEDKPFLVHAIENVRGTVDEVIVCVNDENRKEKYRKVLESYSLSAKIVVDEKTEVGGPMRAIFTGLKTTHANHCLIIPCDMPFIKTNVIEYLFNTSKNFDVVMPMWPNGKLETLFMILKHSQGWEIVQTLCQLYRSHVDDIPRAAAKVLLPSPVKDIKNLDPELKSFININCQKDLEKLQPRNTQNLHIKEDTQFLRENNLTPTLQLVRKAVKMQQENNFTIAQEKLEACKKHFETGNNFFWTAITCEYLGETLLKQLQLQKNTDKQTSLSYKSKVQTAFLDAANNYDNEAKIYDKTGCIRLLERSFTDKTRCKSLYNKYMQ